MEVDIKKQTCSAILDLYMEIKRRRTINVFLLLTDFEDIKLLLVFTVNKIFSLQRFDRFQSAAGVLSTAFSCLHQINYHLVLVRLLQGQGVVRCYYNCQYYVAIIQEAIKILTGDIKY